MRVYIFIFMLFCYAFPLTVVFSFWYGVKLICMIPFFHECPLLNRYIIMQTSSVTIHKSLDYKISLNQYSQIASLPYCQRIKTTRTPVLAPVREFYRNTV